VLPWPVIVQIITSRTLIGFAIGISSLAMGHWAIHGLAMGLLFSLPLAFSGLMAPDNPQFSKTSMWVWTVVLGMVYGLLIEVITSVLFKARQKK
jgi:membrane protein DedA with SNARE-associated domain